MNYKSKQLFGSLVLLAFIFTIPTTFNQDTEVLTQVTLLFLAGLGILFSKILILSSNENDNLGIEPVIIVLLSTFNSYLYFFPVIIVFLFLGNLLNRLKANNKMSIQNQIIQICFQSILYIFLIRLSGFIFWNFQNLLSKGTIQTYLALFLSLIPVLLIRILSILYTNNQSFVNTLKTTLRINFTQYTLMLLLITPSAYSIIINKNSQEIILNTLFSIISVLFVRGLNLKLNRSAFEQSNELEIEISLKNLSQALFNSNSEISAIKVLSVALSDAWKCNTAVGWKTLIYYHNKKWDKSKAIVIKHQSGLKIWLDSFSSTVPIYVRSFINRTVPVLISLETEKKLTQASWDSMETLVSFVEENKSEFAGFSRRVASTAYNLTAAINKNNWYKDCMRIAGLLHMVPKQNNKKSVESTNQFFQSFALPDITSLAIENFTEQWHGSGPFGKSKEEIPLPGRILAVSIAWENTISLGKNIAIRDIRMKSGKIYDPKLVELIIKQNL